MSGSISCSTCTRAGYEYEKGHQYNHPDKLQAQEEGQEGEQEEEEREIDVVTPVNPKVSSTGELPEPDVGILPPVRRRLPEEANQS